MPMWVELGSVTAGLVAGLARNRYKRSRLVFDVLPPLQWPANDNEMEVAPTATVREANRSRGHRPAACGGGDGSGFDRKAGP